MTMRKLSYEHPSFLFIITYFLNLNVSYTPLIEASSDYMNFWGTSSSGDWAVYVTNLGLKSLSQKHLIW